MLDRFVVKLDLVVNADSAEWAKELAEAAVTVNPFLGREGVEEVVVRKTTREGQ